MRIPLFWIEGTDKSVAITLAIDNEYPNKYDHDLKVGLTDRKNGNFFWIVDNANYCSYPPCYPIALHGVKTLVSGKAPRIFKMTIVPEDKYGYCETAQDGGYTNIGVFDDKLDPSRDDMYLELVRDEPDENYFIHYISIEIRQMI